MFRRPLYCLALLLILAASSVAQAQDAADCTPQIQDALVFVDAVCSETGRNQICYGNQLLEATAIKDAASFSFEAPGDLANLLAIDTLRLSQLRSPDEWGVALMQIQANLPSTLPGQNVIMLLFGEVEIDNAGSEAPPLLNGTITSSANLRAGPGTGFAVVGAGSPDMSVEVEGRNADSSWFRFQVPEEESSAWIFGDLIEVEGDIETLPVLEGDESAGPRFGPMQAFYFRTGVSATQCLGAPRDGILVQTPQGQGEILIQANEVDIRLASTAYLRAIPGDYMTVDLLEGQGRVTALGASVFVPAGARARIPLDAAGLPNGPPELTVYAEEDVLYLPVDNLTEVIEVAAPLDEAALLDASIEGEWTWVEDFPAIFCGNDSGRVTQDAYGSGEVFRIELTETGIHLMRPAVNFENEFPQTGPNVYSISATTPVQGAGSITTSVRYEWTSTSGGVTTIINEYALSYCNQTFERSVAFERAE